MVLLEQKTLTVLKHINIPVPTNHHKNWNSPILIIIQNWSFWKFQWPKVRADFWKIVQNMQILWSLSVASIEKMVKRVRERPSSLYSKLHGALSLFGISEYSCSLNRLHVSAICISNMQVLREWEMLFQLKISFFGKAIWRIKNGQFWSCIDWRML